MIPSSTVVNIPTNHSPIDIAAIEQAPQAAVNSRSSLGSIANAVNMIGGTLLVGGLSTAVFGLSASTNG